LYKATFIGNTGKVEENVAQFCVLLILGHLCKMEHSSVCGVTGTVVENGAQLYVLVILGQLGKMEHRFVSW